MTRRVAVEFAELAREVVGRAEPAGAADLLDGHGAVVQQSVGGLEPVSSTVTCSS